MSVEEQLNKVLGMWVGSQPLEKLEASGISPEAVICTASDVRVDLADRYSAFNAMLNPSSRFDFSSTEDSELFLNFFEDDLHANLYDLGKRYGDMKEHLPSYETMAAWQIFLEVGAMAVINQLASWFLQIRRNSNLRKEVELVVKPILRCSCDANHLQFLKLFESIDRNTFFSPKIISKSALARAQALYYSLHGIELSYTAVDRLTSTLSCANFRGRSSYEVEIASVINQHGKSRLDQKRFDPVKVQWIDLLDNTFANDCKPDARRICLWDYHRLVMIGVKLSGFIDSSDKADALIRSIVKEIGLSEEEDNLDDDLIVGRDNNDNTLRVIRQDGTCWTH